jgi:hypothetical protein
MKTEQSIIVVLDKDGSRCIRSKDFVHVYPVKKREYLFLLSGCFRTEHIQAQNLRQAWKKTKKLIEKYVQSNDIKIDQLYPINMYKVAKSGAFDMGPWLASKDKKIIKDMSDFKDMLRVVHKLTFS